MSRPSRILKRTLLFLLGLMLFLPLLQDQFNFATLEPLRGDIVYPKPDSLSAEGWFSGRYQYKKEVAVNDLFGLRSFCLRLHNQVSYSLFKKSRVKTLVVGKENYLYELGYIHSYIGRDCIGQDSATLLLNDLKFVSDRMAAEGKQLLLVFAPGKASYYPEFIPDKYVREKEFTNYELLSKGAQERRLNVMDVNAWFKVQKKSAKYPLYPQYGIHWSVYGSVLVADSLVKTIERLRSIDMPDISYDSLTMEQPHGIDYDMGDGLNLLGRLKSFDMAYVKLKFENPEGKTRPAVLVISDSFYWGMFDFGLTKSFKNDHFWYYNRQVFPESFKEKKYVSQLSLRSELDKHDVVVIMATEPNLRKLGWGFIQSAKKMYKGYEQPHSAEYFKRLRSLVAYIRTDASWFKATTLKAQEAHITLDDQLVKEAKWVLDKEGLY